MAAATAPRNARKKDGKLVGYKMGVTKINKGIGVSLRADGYAYPARSGTATDKFIGVSYETVDNSAGAAGDKTILIEKEGAFVFNKATAVQADLVTDWYFSDDNTLTATSTNNQFAGNATELVSGSELRIRIDNAVK